jgi:hypothetical protein
VWIPAAEVAYGSHMHRDYYLEAHHLAHQLAGAGLDGWSTVLEDVLAGGSTSTEILMGLRWNLRKLIQDEDGLDAGIRAAAGELADAIDAALG